MASNPRHHHPGSYLQAIGIVRKNHVGQGLQFSISGGPRAGTYFIRPGDIPQMFQEGIPVPVLAFTGEPFEGEPLIIGDCHRSQGGNMIHIKFRFKPKTTDPIPKNRRPVEAMFQIHPNLTPDEQEDPAAIDLLGPLTVVQEWARAEGRWADGRVVA